MPTAKKHIAAALDVLLSQGKLDQELREKVEVVAKMVDTLDQKLDSAYPRREQQISELQDALKMLLVTSHAKSLGESQVAMLVNFAKPVVSQLDQVLNLLYSANQGMKYREKSEKLQENVVSLQERIVAKGAKQ